MPSAQFDRTWPQSPAPWASCRGYHSLVRIVLALYPNTACIPKIDDERMSIHLWKLTLNPTHGPHAVWTSSDGRSSSEGHLQVVLWVSSGILKSWSIDASPSDTFSGLALGHPEAGTAGKSAGTTCKTSKGRLLQLPQRCRLCWEAEAGNVLLNDNLAPAKSRRQPTNPSEVILPGSCNS